MHGPPNDKCSAHPLHAVRAMVFGALSEVMWLLEPLRLHPTIELGEGRWSHETHWTAAVTAERFVEQCWEL
jgi:hypothetical protein